MIKELATDNRLRGYKLDGCLDPIIQGKFGHLYEHSETQMGVCLEHPVESRLGARAMCRKMRQIDGLGLQNRQRGETEGTWMLPMDFVPEHPCFAGLLKIIGVRRIRKATGRPFAKQDRP